MKEKLACSLSKNTQARSTENKALLKAIIERVAHADAKTTTQIYTHVTKKLKANVAEIMENY